MDTKTQKKEQGTLTTRSPVVVVMGHIDHGKSKLLDYIRKTNIVEEEAGGITQHMAAYEVTRKNKENKDMKITFLDTPGHEAFSRIRERGANVADIAILVVSAEDGVKAQTIEALNVIHESDIPFVVAINKIDKPEANVEKTINDLIENEIYLEGYGGDVPYAQISAKVGTDVDELLDLVMLVAELKEFKGDISKKAEGFVLESSLDPKRGVSATLIIKDGTLKKGNFVVSGDSFAPTRIFEDFMGKTISKATFSSPIRIVGWSKTPNVGDSFMSFENKKDAEQYICQNIENKAETLEKNTQINKETKLIPIVIKADTSGSIEAIEKEISKMNNPEVAFKIIKRGIGAIGESDLEMVEVETKSIIVGFNVKIESVVSLEAERFKVFVRTFNIIYELSDWLKEKMEEQRPKKEVEEITGEAKVQKTFSRTKERQVIGGKVLSGKIVQKAMVKILRWDKQIGEGVIIELQSGKIKTTEVNEGNEFGMMIETKTEVAPGDILESFIIVCK